VADCLALLLTGSILTGITCTWTNVIGLWFYALMLMVLEVVIYIKTESVVGPAMLGVVLGVLMVGTLPPAMATVPAMILTVNFAIVIYMLFKSQ